MTGFGNQTGLDNIPASSIERIEIINNPSSKYDANGNAGIINIIMKKNKQEGFNGKVGFTTGLGALWVRKENLPTIRPQYTFTPKVNPSLSLNYRKENKYLFQADNLYTQTLNKNEFVTRTYDDGTIIKQQLKPETATQISLLQKRELIGISTNTTLTVSGLFGSEKIIDRGDQPFFNADLSERLRLWQFWKMNWKQPQWLRQIISTNSNKQGICWMLALIIPFIVKMKNIFTITICLLQQERTLLNYCRTSKFMIWMLIT